METGKQEGRDEQHPQDRECHIQVQRPKMNLEHSQAEGLYGWVTRGEGGHKGTIGGGGPTTSWQAQGRKSGTS